MPRFLFAFLLLSSWLPLRAAVPTPAGPAPITIAAAADLKYVLDSLVTIFNRQHPQARATVVYGSSGKFYEQLSHDAPFDIFFSADNDYPRRLQQAGRTAGAPTPYALGRLVLWSKKLDPSALGIKTLLVPQVRRIAIANPAHAPYGRKAEEVLRTYKLYDQVKPKLIFGENIGQTAQYAATGAADNDYPRRLQQAGRTAGAPTPYALGRLVLWSKKLDPSALSIKTLLAPQVRRIAIANPAHAPYGRKAEEALRTYKLYDQVKPKLIFGENIGQTAQYAATGAADVGVLAYSLALSPELRRAGKFYLIPATAHTPLQQSFVVLKRAQGNATAVAFAAFMASPVARQALKKYGFSN